MYHRVLSHNAVKVPRAVEVALTLLGGLSLQGSTLGWVATHNAHHKNQGTPKDPHSPAQSHWLAIQLLGYTFREVNGRHAARLMRDDWHLWFHRNYWKLYGPLLFGSLFLLPTHWAWALFWAPPRWSGSCNRWPTPGATTGARTRPTKPTTACGCSRSFWATAGIGATTTGPEPCAFIASIRSGGWVRNSLASRGSI